MSEPTEWQHLDSGRRHHTRLELAWHVLRGRPLIYRAEIGGPIHVKNGPRLYVVETHIHCGQQQPAGCLPMCEPGAHTYNCPNFGTHQRDPNCGLTHEHSPTDRCGGTT